MVAGHVLMQPKSLSAHGDSQKQQQQSSLCFNLHEVGLKPLTKMPLTQAAILTYRPGMPSRLSAARLLKSILARLPLITLARAYARCHLIAAAGMPLRAPYSLSLCA